MWGRERECDPFYFISKKFACDKKISLSISGFFVNVWEFGQEAFLTFSQLMQRMCETGFAKSRLQKNQGTIEKA